jgi:hypothetical protein
MEVQMLFRKYVLLLLISVIALPGNSKEKTKTTLPDFVLNAKTVRVLVDPEAGTAVNAPMANKTAQEDVEKALQKWGRLSPVFSQADVDLVIVVRKGTEKVLQPIITGQPTNNRPVVVQPSDTGIHVGVNQGRTPGNDPENPQPTAPTPGVEKGHPEDMFFVYDGRGTYGPETAPVWRYVAKNALKSPEVPAVAEFRKAIEAALKQAKGKP